MCISWHILQTPTRHALLSLDVLKRHEEPSKSFAQTQHIPGWPSLKGGFAPSWPDHHEEQSRWMVLTQAGFGILDLLNTPTGVVLLILGYFRSCIKGMRHL